MLFVTAVTYQFRGWLAASMVNENRGETILIATGCIFGITLAFPLANWLQTAFVPSHQDAGRAASHEIRNQNGDGLYYELKAVFTSIEEHVASGFAKDETAAAKRPGKEQPMLDNIKRWTTRVDIAFPPGWLAMGAMSAANQNVWPALLGSVGFCLLGGASLRRSYRTTLQFYRREDHSPRVATHPSVRSLTNEKQKANFLEMRLGRVSDPTAAVALAHLRYLMRAPEVKHALSGVFFLVVVFGCSVLPSGPFSVLPGRPLELTEPLRPLLAMGLISTFAIGMRTLMQNQFGDDRDGFRALVLSPVPWQDILLGKNLALTPVFLGTCGLLLSVLQIVYPLYLSEFVASLMQLASVYVICCLGGNYVSILLPFRAPPPMKAAKKSFTLSLGIIFANLLSMLALTPVALPVGLAILSHHLNWGQFLPVYLIAATALLGTLVIVYWFVLSAQGELLQSREQKILDAVTTKND